VSASVFQFNPIKVIKNTEGQSQRPKKDQSVLYVERGVSNS
jgi:hypothetical protein